MLGEFNLHGCLLLGDYTERQRVTLELLNGYER